MKKSYFQKLVDEGNFIVNTPSPLSVISSTTHWKTVLGAKKFLKHERGIDVLVFKNSIVVCEVASNGVLVVDRVLDTMLDTKKLKVQLDEGVPLVRLCELIYTETFNVDKSLSTTQNVIEHIKEISQYDH